MLRRKRTKKIKNMILAIPADATAIPVKPSKAAMRATTKNANAIRNIADSFSLEFRCYKKLPMAKRSANCAAF
jgi:hypothetical protein